uniref:AA_permease domain-containing protein n=1 Tax=Meloidogyne hapla TaxID=6305 RepID=A0A1I8BFM3_MELHA
MSLVNAFFAGLFSYDGWDVLNFGAEEVENPKRTMPFAILSGMFCVTSIYIVINLSYLVVLDANTVFAQQSLGQFQHIMPFIIILVMMGALNGTIFTASRYLFAAARSRQVPSFLALLNPENDSPRSSIFAHVLMAILFSFVGDTNQLINYLGFAQWLQRAFTMCALLWIRLGYKKYNLHPDAIKTPIVII